MPWSLNYYISLNPSTPDGRQSGSNIASGITKPTYRFPQQRRITTSHCYQTAKLSLFRAVKRLLLCLGEKRKRANKGEKVDDDGCHIYHSPENDTVPLGFLPSSSISDPPFPIRLSHLFLLLAKSRLSVILRKATYVTVMWIHHACRVVISYVTARHIGFGNRFSFLVILFFLSVTLKCDSACSHSRRQSDSYVNCIVIIFRWKIV